MTKIALLSDSCCDLSCDTLKKYNIHLFPIRIIYKDREYLDKINISAKEMYDTLEQEIPTTSLPDLHYCEQLIDSLSAQGYTDFLVITISSHLSGTSNSLKLLATHYSSINFHFFDTKTLGYPQGVIAVEAAKLLQEGLNCEEVLERLDVVRHKVDGYIAPATLEYLKRGGRIGRGAAKIGEILHLRPIIAYNDEGLYTYTKARGKKQAFSKLKALLLEHLNHTPCRVWVLQGNGIEEATEFMNEIKHLPNITELSLETIGPSMGIHTGPGVIGFVILEI